MQRRALCRSRRERSNAYLLAKFGFDIALRYLQFLKIIRSTAAAAAENEHCKVCPLSELTNSRFARRRSSRRSACCASTRSSRPPEMPSPFVTGCGKVYRARSRLYRNEILQLNMRWKALAEILSTDLKSHFFLKVC